MRAESDHCCFSRSADIVGAHRNLNGSRDLTTPLSRMVSMHGLALATIDLSTVYQT